MQLTTRWCRAAFLLLPGFLAAHELETSVAFSAPAVIVRGAYGGSEPVPFAKVEIFSPSTPAPPFQTGRTDRRGYFSFVPDGPGTWRAVIDDEEGHRREAKMTIPDPFQSNTQHVAARPGRFERVLLGLGLIFGFTGFLYGFKARRRS